MRVTKIETSTATLKRSNIIKNPGKSNTPKDNPTKSSPFLSGISFNGHSKNNTVSVHYGASGEICSGPLYLEGIIDYDPYKEIMTISAHGDLGDKVPRHGNPGSSIGIGINTYYADPDEVVNPNSLPYETEAIVEYVEPEMPKFSQVQQRFNDPSGNRLSYANNLLFFEVLAESQGKKKDYLAANATTQKMDNISAIAQLVGREKELRSQEFMEYLEIPGKLDYAQRKLEENRAIVAGCTKEKKELENPIKAELEKARAAYDDLEGDGKAELRFAVSIAQAKLKRTEPKITKLAQQIEKAQAGIEEIGKLTARKQEIENSQSYKDLIAKRAALLSEIEEEYRKNYPEYISD